MENPKENLDAVKSEILDELRSDLEKGNIPDSKNILDRVAGELKNRGIEGGIDSLEFIKEVLDGTKDLIKKYQDKARIEEARLKEEEARFDDQKLKDVLIEQEKKIQFGDADLKQVEQELKSSKWFASKKDTGKIESWIGSMREKLDNIDADLGRAEEMLARSSKDKFGEIIKKLKEKNNSDNFALNYIDSQIKKIEESSEFDDPKLKDFIEEQEKKYNSGEISLEQFEGELKTKSSFASREDTERIKDKIASVQAKYIMSLEPEKEAQSKTEKVNADLGEENLQGDENGLKGVSNLEGDEVKKEGEKAVLEKAESLKQSLLSDEITQREFKREIDKIIRKNNISEDLKEKLVEAKKEAMEEWKEKNPRKLVQNGKSVVQEPGKEPKIEEETPKTHLEEIEKEISDLIKNCESKEECLYKLDGVKKREDSLLSVLGREAEGSQEQKRIVVLVINSIENVKMDRNGKWSKEKVEKEEKKEEKEEGEAEGRLLRLVNQDKKNKEGEKEGEEPRISGLQKKDQEEKEEQKNKEGVGEFPDKARERIKLVEKDLYEEGSRAEFNENFEILCEENKSNPELVEKIKRKQEEILDKWQSSKESAERKKAFEKTANEVVEAEARLKKAEKNQRRYGAIISAFNFRKKAEGEADNELLAAQKNLQEANRKYKDLTRQHMEDAFQDKNVEVMEQKFNAIKAKMDAGILLEDKRMEAQEKGGEGLIGKIQLALRKYHKLPFKTHLKIMGGIILVSSLSPLALSAALSGTVLTTVLVLNRILSTVGGMATAESMIDNRLKKHRAKKGQTLESQRSLAEGYVLEGTEGIDINTMEGKLAFLNKAGSDADSEIARRMSEIKNTEHKQNIGKWLAVAGVGAFFALGGPEKIFRFGKEKLFGKAPEAPFKPIKKPGQPAGAGKVAPMADSNAPAPKFSKKISGGVGSKSAEDLVKDFTEKEMAKEAEFLRTYKGVSKSTQGALSGTVAEKATEKVAEKGAEKIAEKSAEAISKISPEKLIETAKPGDSIWKMLENKSSELFGKEEWYKNMDKIQKIHFTDTLKRKMLEGRPSEFLKVGETVDLSKAFGGDGSIIKNLAKKYVEGGDIIKGGAKYENIEKVSGVIKNNINGWTRAKGSPLTTSEISQKVRDALGEIGGKISKKAGEKISGDIPAVPRWNGLGPRPETITTMADSSAYGRIGNAAERIIKENLGSLKNSLSSVKQSELDIVGHGDAKTFLTKNASPSWAGIDTNDHEGTKAFKNIWKAANEANLSGVADKPKVGESISDWMARNGEKVGVKLKPKKFFDTMSEKMGRIGSF